MQLEYIVAIEYIQNFFADLFWNQENAILTFELVPVVPNERKC